MKEKIEVTDGNMHLVLKNKCALDVFVSKRFEYEASCQLPVLLSVT